jgi:hypothetical protein
VHESRRNFDLRLEVNMDCLSGNHFLQQQVAPGRCDALRSVGSAFAYAQGAAHYHHGKTLWQPLAVGKIRVGAAPKRDGDVAAKLAYERRREDVAGARLDGGCQ